MPSLERTGGSGERLPSRFLSSPSPSPLSACGRTRFVIFLGKRGRKEKKKERPPLVKFPDKQPNNQPNKQGSRRTTVRTAEQTGGGERGERDRQEGKQKRTADRSRRRAEPNRRLIKMEINFWPAASAKRSSEVRWPGGRSAPAAEDAERAEAADAGQGSEGEIGERRGTERRWRDGTRGMQEAGRTDGSRAEDERFGWLGLARTEGEGRRREARG